MSELWKMNFNFAFSPNPSFLYPSNDELIGFILYIETKRQILP